MRTAHAVLLGLGAIALLVWLLAGGPAPSSSPGGATVRTRAPSSGTSLSAAPAEAPTAPKLEGRPHAPRETRSTEPARLRVHVTADDGTLVPGARVEVFGHHMRRGSVSLVKDVEVDRDGTALVEVPIAPRAFWSYVARATHPDCFPAEVEIHLNDPENRADSVALLARGVEVRIARTSVFDGVVVGPKGEPVGGAAVQAFVLEDTGPNGVRTFGPGGYADADGRFHVLVAGEGPAALSVAGGPFRPTWIAVDLHVGSRRDLGTIVLPRGAILAGRVSCPGVARDRIWVIATWYSKRREGTYPAGAQRAVLEDGREMWSQRETSVDEGGAFRLEGLEDGAYRLRVPAEDWGAPLHPDAYAEVDRIVRAPDDRIDVAADRSLCEVVVADAGEGGARGIADAVVTFEGEDVLRLRTDANGLARVVLRADSGHRVRVEAAGFAASEVHVTAAAAGRSFRETVGLVRLRRGTAVVEPAWDPPTRVLVQAQGPDGVPVAAYCRVLRADGTRIPVRLVELRPTLQILSAERLGVGGPSAVFVEDGSVPAAIEIGGGGLGWTRRPWPADVAASSGASSTLLVTLAAPGR